jgi:hypothetical protein
MLQMIAAQENAGAYAGVSRLRAWMAAAALVASVSATPASAQGTHQPFKHPPYTHQPFLQRDLPSTAWHYDGRDDTRDFQNNGFFPGDFAANPPAAWVGAAGIFGFTPQGGSHFGPIYCMRRYRSHNPAPGYFQGDDGVWYRCQR